MIVEAGDGVHLAVAAPRGEAKSTYMLIFAIWCVVFKLKRYLIYVMDTHEQAAVTVEGFKAELEANPRLKMDFPRVAGPGGVWREGEAVARNDVKFHGRGAGQKVRGLKHGAFRPDAVSGRHRKRRACALAGPARQAGNVAEQGRRESGRGGGEAGRVLYRNGVALRQRVGAGLAEAALAVADVPARSFAGRNAWIYGIAGRRFFATRDQDRPTPFIAAMPRRWNAGRRCRGPTSGRCPT